MSALLVLSGCSSSGPEVVTLEDGSQLEVPARSIDADWSAAVPLPSGVLMLDVAPELSGFTSDEGPVRAADGVDLVGVSWSFTPNRASEGRAVLLNGSTTEQLPQPTVEIIGGDGAAVDLSSSVNHGTWELVVALADAQAIEVGYAGLVQTVDLASGAVGSQQAAGLLDLEDATHEFRRPCRTSDFPGSAVLNHGCSVDRTTLLPYIEGLGWSPSANWLVVDATIEGEANMMLGDDAGTELDSGIPGVRRVAYPVRGSAGGRRITFDFGAEIGAVHVPLKP